MSPLCAHYVFHPVGQGLFASGALFGSSPRVAQLNLSFRWVYDCGTLSSQSLVDREIDQLFYAAQNDNSKPSLDLVTISHFDKDHISGLVALLGKFRVKNLLLPYVSLWQRMTLAFDQSVDISVEEMSFFLDPIAFISGIEGAEIEQIILAGSSEAGPSGNDQVEGNDENDTPWKLIFDGDEPKLEVGYQIPVVLLRSGSSLRVAKQWEFVPYNDCETFPKPPQEFLESVNEKRKKLLGATNKDDRVKALKEIKGIYDEEFGKDAKARNGISLHLYGGPIRKTSTFTTSHSCSRPYSCRCCHHWYYHPKCRPACDCVLREEEPLGILYTGDAYLNTAGKLNSLMSYLGVPRCRKLLCLQVMHHGAASSWHAGVASKLAPKISVFSSNPNDGRYHHPDINVWSDFASSIRKQVNEDCGLSVCTHYL